MAAAAPLDLPGPAGSWDLDLAAASLRIDTDDIDQMFQALGDKLERILGARARIVRGGGLLRRQRVDRITVDTTDGRLEAVRGRSGPEFLVVHAVRGITLQTSRIEAGEWLQQLVRLVGQESARSADVRAALSGMLE